MNVIKLAKKVLTFPFYDILEMKNILLENKIHKKTHKKNAQVSVG